MKAGLNGESEICGGPNEGKWEGHSWFRCDSGAGGETVDREAPRLGSCRDSEGDKVEERESSYLLRGFILDCADIAGRDVA